MYLFLGLVFALIFTGCQTSQQMSLLPIVKDGVTPANIYLLRPHIVFGDGVGTSLYLDGQLIAQLGAGDYLVFTVNPGEHMVASKIGDAGLHSQKLGFKSGQDYYFIARRTIEPLSTHEGVKIKQQLKEVLLN